MKRKRGYTRVSPKHQVTLPTDVLAKAGLDVGDRLLVTTSRSGEVVLTREVDAIETYAGRLSGVYPAGYLDELRNEWG
ncbi:MAG: AbrB/MazE/SpoVT family DNA-binding domain-containing protein [Candidatus Limnocylindrales bacterium]